MNTITKEKMIWVRSDKGVLFGVCQGIAPIFGLDVILLRIIWLVALFSFGAGLVLYLILAIALPRVDQLDQAHSRKLLGVCARISKRYDMEVGIVRSGFILLTLVSLGFGGLVLYVILHLVIPKEG